MIGRMFSQRAELYADILTVNPEAPRLSHVFEQEAAYFARAVAMSDQRLGREALPAGRRLHEGLATWAKKQSNLSQSSTTSSATGDEED